MGGGFTPWLPPGYWRRFKERLWRLFGSKNYRGRREEITARAALRLGSIRHKRAMYALSGLLKETYSGYVESLIIHRSPLWDTIRGKSC